MTDYGTCFKHNKPLVPVCPDCGQPVEVYTRPCGYLRPVSCFNDGKQQEVLDRKLYTMWSGDHFSEMTTDYTDEQRRTNSE